MNTTPLSGLQPGQQAVIRALSPVGPMRRRLQELGLTPGTHVTCYQKSPSGSPAAFQFRGAVIALRREDSRGVLAELL